MSKKSYKTPVTTYVFLNLDENYMGGADIISSPGLEGTGSGGSTGGTGEEEVEGDVKGEFIGTRNIWDEEW